MLYSSTALFYRPQEPEMSEEIPQFDSHLTTYDILSPFYLHVYLYFRL